MFRPIQIKSTNIREVRPDCEQGSLFGAVRLTINKLQICLSASRKLHRQTPQKRSPCAVSIGIVDSSRRRILRRRSLSRNMDPLAASLLRTTLVVMSAKARRKWLLSKQRAMLTVCSQPHLRGGKKTERTRERERERERNSFAENRPIRVAAATESY